MSKNIILIGFMGVGKGIVARAIAKTNGFFSVDTDDLIESFENRKIKKIFKNDGELYFRELEEKCALWLEKNVINSIISTGGGFYKQENIHNIGKVVYLESSFDKIIEILKNAPNAEKKFKKRPLLSDLIEARKLYEKRIKEYKKTADIIVNMEDRDIDRICKEILEKAK